MLTACGRPKGGGMSGPCGQRGGGGFENLIFCGRQKWMAPYAPVCKSPKLDTAPPLSMHKIWMSPNFLYAICLGLIKR